ncbi:MAG: hypothetical protein OER87_07465 [Gammaproteobacteria bacterium]|nr:hypothetical protein [Gammaproteobacteria bacterium]
MNTIPPANPYALADASRSAVEGIREQISRLDRNLAEVARGDNAGSFAAGGRDRALVEQTEILRATRANARSLEVANQVLGTIIDIKV